MQSIENISLSEYTIPEKINLLEKLWDSFNYDEIWIDEAQRRDKEMSDNKPVCKSHVEVMQRAKEELM